MKAALIGGLKHAPSWYWTADKTICFILAGVLIFAACAKALRGEPPLDVPFSLDVVVFIELAAALFVLFHRTKRVTRLGIGLFFAVLALVALRAAVTGRPSCGCFGEAQVAPVWLAALDSLAAFWLVVGCILRANHRKIDDAQFHLSTPAFPRTLEQSA